MCTTHLILPVMGYAKTSVSIGHAAIGLGKACQLRLRTQSKGLHDTHATDFVNSGCALNDMLHPTYSLVHL